MPVSGDDLMTPIDGLSIRARNALASLGVSTAGEAATLTESELRESKNVGTTTVIEIQQFLFGIGLCLAKRHHSYASILARIKRLEARCFPERL